MKSLIAITLVTALSACGTQSSTITPAQLKAALNDVPTVIAAGCQVVQPTLAATAVATANAPAGVAAGVNGVFCAANEAAASSANAASAAAPAPAASGAQ